MRYICFDDQMNTFSYRFYDMQILSFEDLLDSVNCMIRAILSVRCHRSSYKLATHDMPYRANIDVSDEIFDFFSPY